MNQHSVHLLDLPNEILFNIVKKLDNVDILYSLFGINNQRLDHIAREDIYSNTLKFVSTDDNTTIIEPIFDRFCNYILIQIRHNLKCLIVEPVYMERILLATHYPNLTEMKLFNFQHDNALCYFSDDSNLRHVFKQQITSLVLISKDHDRTIKSTKDYTKRVYAHILTLFENLKDFNVIQTLIPSYPRLSIRYSPSTTFFSSTLTYLCIKVETFIDCLYILDGRLEQLTTCIVKIYYMDMDSSTVHNTNDLPNLKCFSLISSYSIEDYNNKIVALLRRMLYLEKLILYLRIDHQSVFMDPVHLINDVSIHMSQLESFSFYLGTENDRNDLVRYLSMNDIKRNYVNKTNREVSNIVCFSIDMGTYHIFTLPYEFEELMFIGNIFPTIVFKYVTVLWTLDIVPFKHEFFLRISQAFPLLKDFHVTDLGTRLTDTKKSSDDVQSYPIVKYPHVTSLDILRTNTDCIEQFLDETKTYLPRLTKLTVMYDELRIVTDNFTREVTRHNCANVKRLITRRDIVGSKTFYTYFPLL